MSDPRESWSRREFLHDLTAAGTATLLSTHPAPVAAEPPPETTTIKFVPVPSLCSTPPQYIAEDLLLSEGFTDVRYLRSKDTTAIYQMLASGEGHMVVSFVTDFAVRIDAGDPIVMLAGVHPGCYELFGTDRVRTVRDLKGKTVAVPEYIGGQARFVSVLAAHVGLDPRKDINWVRYPAVEAKRLLADGKVDAYLGLPPDPQELRAKKIGHVVVNSAVDRPWSQYFCCMLAGNREFVRTHPVAVRRALRALLKAVTICATDPERAARSVVAKGLTNRYDYALQTIKELPYAKWQDYDPEDTVRFYSLRLHEAGMIKSSPQKILAQGTDWRFLNELKKELKG